MSSLRNLRYAFIATVVFLINKNAGQDFCMTAPSPSLMIQCEQLFRMDRNARERHRRKRPRPFERRHRGRGPEGNSRGRGPQANSLGMGPEAAEPMVGYTVLLFLI